MATSDIGPTVEVFAYEIFNETVYFLNDTSNATYDNVTFGTDTPLDLMRLPGIEDYLIRLVLCVVIFIVSTAGNIAVLCSLLHGRRRKSRVNLLIMHLTVADLMITFFNIPMDFIWILTLRWYGGDVACRVCMYIAMLGLYASPFILIVISLDRFASIVFPLSVRQADMRCKIMLRVAWIACIVASAPQLFIHEVMTPSDYPEHTQCVDYGFRIRYPAVWNIYHWFVACSTYFFPLTLIIGCYTAIVLKIFGHSSIRSYSGNNGNRMTLRRSGADTLPKARQRALMMTGAIVTAFIVCWTPSCVEGAITHIDPDLGEKTPLWLKQVMLALMYSNACVDPIVYGMFTVDFRRYFPGCFECRGRRLPWWGRKISRQSMTSSNNFQQTTYATSSRMSATTGMTTNYHVIDYDKSVAEKCV